MCLSVMIRDGLCFVSGRTVLLLCIEELKTVTFAGIGQSAVVLEFFLIFCFFCIVKYVNQWVKLYFTILWDYTNKMWILVRQKMYIIFYCAPDLYFDCVVHYVHWLWMYVNIDTKNKCICPIESRQAHASWKYRWWTWRNRKLCPGYAYGHWFVSVNMQLFWLLL